ncbi:MAG: M48 family metallopeptidase [Burkholderiales bacterium]|nr:M48 family metallopeptidase [Burkholderiales bacterium]
MTRRLRLILVALLAAALAGCATNPITGRSQFMLVSEDYAIGGSAAAYRSMIGQLESKGKLETGTPRAQKVHEITDRLIAQAVRFRPDTANWDWQIELINEPKTINAFCMAGGKMGIYTGFWDKLEATDDEIAAVMGHEIAHAVVSHPRERMSVAIGVGVGATVAAAVLSGDSRDFDRNAQIAAIAAALAITLPNSREAESEADQIGIELAARAGYDPKAAVTLWQKMAKEDSRAPMEFLSTHPAAATRIERLQALVPQVEPLYVAARKRPETRAPSFLAVPEASNERRVARAGEETREEYARRAAKTADALTFVADEVERFRRGEVVFTCTFACSITYRSNKGEWPTYHRAGAWRELAVSVMRAETLSDLSYFMLGEAAKGLGFDDAARAYYRRAREAARDGHACGGLLSSCEGFEVTKLVSAALGETR